MIKTLLFLFFSCTIIFFGCKKSGNKFEPEQTELENSSIALMKEKIKSEGPGISTLFQINEKIVFDYNDANGNKISPASSGIMTNAIDNCDPGADAPRTTSPVQVVRKFNCGSGYIYTVEYTISTPVPFTQTNPYYPTVTTKGTIRLKRSNTSSNTAASVAFTEENLPVTLVLLGDDPDDPDRYLYRCSFATSYIDPAIVADGAWLEPRITVATTCDVFPSANQGTVVRVTVWSSIVSPNGQPCSRTDKCFANPSSSGSFGSIAGSDVFGYCSAAGVTLSQFHDFEYRVITGFDPTYWTSTGTPGAWAVVPVASSSTAPASSPQGTLGYWEVRTLPVASFPVGGVFEFRYRNRMVSGTGAPCTGLWSAPARLKFY